MDIYQYSFTVPDKVVDENGHVNNVEYVRWMQEAATQHAEAAGCLQATKAAGASWIVRSHQIEYLRPLFAGDEVCILTWVANFRKVRSLRKYKFIRSVDDAVLAQGATDWVLIDTQSKRPRLISEEVKGALVLVPETQEP
ncbi:MAG: acyl-CoA thioesterase [Planctomycetes bacterium]|nr:acyl-CoA thioesterase [Planctomycetota bacterium]